jgi:hypothetical protein
MEEQSKICDVTCCSPIIFEEICVVGLLSFPLDAVTLVSVWFYIYIYVCVCMCV